MQSLVDRYTGVRRATEQLAAPLSAEDQLLQSMPDASPTKWHRAHTTWFFEAFLLGPCGVAPFDPRYAHLFNSYYEAVGPRHPRPRRGMLSRPTAEEIAAYRAAVDSRVVSLLQGMTPQRFAEVAPIVRLGLAHEEQHQELVLTDILHALSQSPLQPAYRRAPAPQVDASGPTDMRFVSFEGGLHRLGGEASAPFVFDNELPRHSRWLEPFALGDRLVTVREVRAFIEGGGYRAASLWLSDGWDFVRSGEITAPMYADLRDGQYTVFGLDGSRVASDDEPALHLSLYEADAIARFLGGRLPTEAEWEVAAAAAPVEGNFVESGALCARPARAGERGIRQLFGDAWEWTRSAYDPYPGYAPSAGALGEYNGKFMANQFVLRGGSCLTPAGHVRASYRNFWPPATRFQATGVRVAKDLAPPVAPTPARSGSPT